MAGLLEAVLGYSVTFLRKGGCGYACQSVLVRPSVASCLESGKSNPVPESYLFGNGLHMYSIAPLFPGLVFLGLSNSAPSPVMELL